jgi:crossover junction endodeoxyribonuclease RusA
MLTPTLSLDEARVTLPWPDKVLSPNGRGNWGKKARLTKAARYAAWALTLEAIGGRRPGWDRVAVHWEFHPKTANVVDGDNAEASCKAFRDGIADALGIDDSKFQTTRSMSDPVKGGAVIVTVKQA